jgi:exopolysaccharide biosynthesis polyprenyl glycosylphosphotransferase
VNPAILQIPQTRPAIEGDERPEEAFYATPRRLSVINGKTALWMLLDAVTVMTAAVASSMYGRQLENGGAERFVARTPMLHQSTGSLLALLCGFAIIVVAVSHSLLLYSPIRLRGALTELGRTIQACFTAALLLTGALYVVKAQGIPREIVLLMIVMVTIALSLRRLIFRVINNRRFDRGLGKRNVLIIGTGAEAAALRDHIENIRHLGYNFKGFIELSGQRTASAIRSGDIAGNIDTLFQTARQHFVDEILVATQCDKQLIRRLVMESRLQHLDVRVVPEMYDGLAWNRPIEYIGQFPTIPLHRGEVPELELVLKRGFDIAISGLALAILAPLMLLVAIAVKLDSTGPVFYVSERIGKKGCVFRCTKFRTMVRDADERLTELLHMNERDGILFKVTCDPRITHLGRMLRKYSLDELPQLFDVLRGDMSLVGPRPPLANEVRKYQLSHLRRLDVHPGITGLWQVQARQDPSFDNYISLDVAYIDNWSIWLDLKILARTVGVVLQGTGA